MLELKNINISARLFDVNTSFEAGRKHAVIGINGAGKTSLLDAISGKISRKNIKGSIFLNDKDMMLFGLKKRAQKLAYLAQNTQVLAWFKPSIHMKATFDSI